MDEREILEVLKWAAQWLRWSYALHQPRDRERLWRALRDLERARRALEADGTLSPVAAEAEGTDYNSSSQSSSSAGLPSGSMSRVPRQSG